MTKTLQHRGDQSDRPQFSCPECGHTSYHPSDISEGYCVSCHDWTGPQGRPTLPFILQRDDPQ